MPVTGTRSVVLLDIDTQGVALVSMDGREYFVRRGPKAFIAQPLLAEGFGPAIQGNSLAAALAAAEGVVMVADIRQPPLTDLPLQNDLPKKLP